MLLKGVTFTDQGKKGREKVCVLWIITALVAPLKLPETALKLSSHHKKLGKNAPSRRHNIGLTDRFLRRIHAIE